MINKKIVFYIRAIFKESISTRIENSNIQESVKIFNRFSNIKAEDYREELHNIQIDCLKNISENFIYNHPDKVTDRGWNYTYDVLQKNTIDKLKQITDDHILIPMDDDDWLSPEISKINFCKNGLTIWNTVSTRPISTLFYHKKHVALPRKLETDEHILESRHLLSHCGAFSGNIIKKLIDDGEIQTLEQMLQRHTKPRKIIREDRFVEQNYQEMILDDYFAVYVLHACNVTAIAKLSSEENFNILKNKYKNVDVDTVLNQIPENYKWCIPYYMRCIELNKKL